MDRMKLRMESAALTAGMIVTSLNIVIGAPLAGLLVGSRLTGDTQISMLAVLAVVVVTLTVGYGLVRVLGYLGATHSRLTGVSPTVRRHVSWMRPMSGERQHYQGVNTSLTALDYVLVAVVVATLLAFEIWFMFYSTSPLDGRTGRS